MNISSILGYHSRDPLPLEATDSSSFQTLHLSSVLLFIKLCSIETTTLLYIGDYSTVSGNYGLIVDLPYAQGNNTQGRNIGMYPNRVLIDRQIA